MFGHLEVIAGPDKGRSFPLAEENVLQIGRGPSSDTRLCDRFVSRLHCRVAIVNGVVQLSDLGGAGGTSVNGIPIGEPRTIVPGDRISIGDTIIELRLSDVHDQGTIRRSACEDSSAISGAGETPEWPAGRLDRFQIVRSIGRGTNSWVYCAADNESSETVALKILKPEFSHNAQDLKRVLRGVETALPLRHPNLVSVLGTGQAEGHVWIAMEYVEGESLRSIIERIGIANILDWRYALRVAVHICRALDYIHGRDIVHRNITPSNLLVRNQDNTTKLSDVTLAKALEGNWGRQQISRPGELVGDLAYMAPERTKDNSTIDQRSDIYELGATVYALLTGRAPCLGKSQAETIEKIRNAVPESPKVIQLSIPDSFAELVLQMIAKDPKDRQSTAASLLERLERVAQEERVSF